MNSSISSRIESELYRVIDKLLSDLEIDVPAYDNDTEFSELSLDSMKIVEILFELESHFQVQVDEGQIAEVSTVGGIVSMFENAIAEQ